MISAQTIIIPIKITGFASEDQPGWVWCELEDVNGRKITFIEKTPVVTTDYVGRDSTYPCTGVIECEVISIDSSKSGKLMTVCVAAPRNLNSGREDIQFEIFFK